MNEPILNPLRWERKPGKARQVCVGDRINRCAVTDDEKFMLWDYATDSWQTLPGEGGHICDIGKKGALFGISMDGRAIKYNPAARRWDDLKLEAEFIDVGDENNVVAINSKKELFRLVDGKWNQLPGTFVRASVGSDGTLWAVKESGFIFKWRGGKEKGREWQRMEGLAKSISCGDVNNCVIVTPEEDVMKFTAGMVDHWFKVAGGVASVGTAYDGTVISRDAQLNIYVHEHQHAFGKSIDEYKRTNARLTVRQAKIIPNGWKTEGKDFAGGIWSTKSNTVRESPDHKVWTVLLSFNGKKISLTESGLAADEKMKTRSWVLLDHPFPFSQHFAKLQFLPSNNQVNVEMSCMPIGRADADRCAEVLHAYIAQLFSSLEA